MTVGRGRIPIRGKRHAVFRLARRYVPALDHEYDRTFGGTSAMDDAFGYDKPDVAEFYHEVFEVDEESPFNHVEELVLVVVLVMIRP